MVDFIHRNPVLAHAVAWEWQKDDVSTRPGDIHTSWSSFSQRDPEETAQWVALDAFADDLVPLPLKVRTIFAHGKRCIVLGKLNAAQHAALSAEGAVAVLEEDLTAAEIPRRIERVVTSTPERPRQGKGVGTALTDREIQILELYARRRALTASTLAAALGLHTTTVRGHLARGRKKLAAAGLRCGSRGELALALQEIGYSHTDAQWSAIGRW
nr:hypothetical protein [Paenarthrobacter ilicis]